MKAKTRTLQCVCILIVVAFSTAWTESSRAAIPFTHTTDLVTAAPSSRGVAAGDFNRDGFLDLVLTGSEDASIHGSVSIFQGNGDGTFSQRATYTLPYGALAVAAADVNSDTFPDLVVGTRESYLLMLGNGDGSFAPATPLDGIGITFVTFADLNADGRPDVVASTASSVRIHLGNGDGTFRPAIAVTFPCVYGEALPGDFNADGRTDLAVIRCPDVVSILLGNGDGTFQSPVDYRVTHGPNAGDVGDLNSDGRLDLAIVGTQSSTVSVLMGNGDGTFTPGATIATGVYPIDAELGDLNSDNIPDLVAAVYFGNTVEVSAGRGDGTFEPTTSYASGITPSVALGDWDRDGLLDIAASNWGAALAGSRISIFRNTPGVLVGASPVVTAPSTVNGNMGSLITFNVSAGDPDGEAISSLRALQLLDRGELPVGATFTPDATNTSGMFRWTPGSSAGGRSFDVAFVAQNALSGSARTTIFVSNVPNVCGATVFNGYDTIRLGTGKPTWYAFVQPENGCYENSDVMLSSVVLEYAGRQIPAVLGKTTFVGDNSGDGIQDIRVSFTKADLRTLFSGLPSGHNLVTVAIKGSLSTGGVFRGTTEVDVVSTGTFSAPEVAPNPLNPAATVTYTTAKTGFVRIDLFDIHGRLVRRIVDEPAMAAGTHEATIDGRGQRGEKLPSGVYFIRGTSPEGEFKNIITILK